MAMAPVEASAVFPDATPLLIDAMTGYALPARLTIHHGPSEGAELQRRLQGHPVVLSNESVIDADLIAQCPDLRAIIFLGTGASSYIDLAACAARDIRVRTIAGYGDRSVAEHTIALLFAVYRDLGFQQETMRAGGWSGNPIGELQGKCLGIIGMGAIGAEVAAIARALGMTVIGWSRGTDLPDVTRCALDELLTTADIVSLHLALTPETQGLIGARELALLREGAVLINTARGALLDEAALVEALVQGKLAGAGLDVFAVEPLQVDHPLRTAPRVVMSCHSGWQSPEAASRLMARALALVAEEQRRLMPW